VRETGLPVGESKFKGLQTINLDIYSKSGADDESPSVKLVEGKAIKKLDVTVMGVGEEACSLIEEVLRKAK
jgi:hypothetical protein